MNHIKTVTDGTINTYSGKVVSLIDPQPEQIDIRDIARGLANNSHFGGQTPGFFSIAEHCLMVCNLLDEKLRQDPKMLLLALLHDASEAYMGDMVKPLKVHLPKFKEYEDRLMHVILTRYNLDPEKLPLIKPADKEAQELEYADFYKRTFAGPQLKYYDPHTAYHHFKNRYYTYCRSIVNLEK